MIAELEELLETSFIYRYHIPYCLSHFLLKEMEGRDGRGDTSAGGAVLVLLFASCISKKLK